MDTKNLSSSLIVKLGPLQPAPPLQQMGVFTAFLCPLVLQHPQYLFQWVLDPPTESIDIRLPRQEEEEASVGKGFEVELGKFWLNPETNKWVRWHERYLVVYSQSLAASAIRGQQQRINTAQTALNKLAAKPGSDREQLILKVENILKRYRVKDFFSTMITEEITKFSPHNYVLPL